MKFKAVSGIMLMLLLIGMLLLAFGIQPVKAIGTVYIRANGSVDPPTANITTADNITYTFKDNNYDSIVIERSNITVDGAGFKLQGTGSGTGMNITGRSNVTIKNMEINGFYYGIYLSQSSNNTISGDNVTYNEYGIILGGSSNNTISGDNVTYNEYGIYFSQSSNNTLSGNNVTANTQYGIVLSSSSNNILRDNSMVNNGYNFRVSGPTLIDFVNDVDTSNTVDGKTIYYWINRRDSDVPLDAGYVALVNCTSITIQNLNLSKNHEGTVLVYTTNSTITKNNITNNSLGIQFLQSSNNTVSGNIVAANTQYGIVLSSSSNNTISGNNITENDVYGIVLGGSSNNTIYHNNFINNTNQAYDDNPPSNNWHHLALLEGNYWSDYAGVDDGSGVGKHAIADDEIGDTLIPHPDTDYDLYPLMEPWTPSQPTPVGGIHIPVDKFSLLAPYVTLVSATIIAVVVAYIKTRKKK